MVVVLEELQVVVLEELHAVVLDHLEGHVEVAAEGELRKAFFTYIHPARFKEGKTNYTPASPLTSSILTGTTFSQPVASCSAHHRS